MNRPIARALAAGLASVAALGGVAAAGSAAPAASSPQAPAPQAPAPRAPAADSGGSSVVGQRRVAPQVLDVTFYSAALNRETTTRLLLPPGWSPGGNWPALFLLHGYNDPARQNSWTAYTEVERFLADKPVLTVLPDIGRASFPNDFVGEPNERYETFVTGELPGLLRQFGASERRAIAGISTGGYGAMALAAKHPGLFAGAASYSGLLNPTLPGIDRFIQVMLVNIGMDRDALWGDPVLDRSTWEENDPTLLVENLRGTKLFVAGGTGARGEHDAGPLALARGVLDDPDTGSAADKVTAVPLATALESGTQVTSRRFVAEAERAGINVEQHWTTTGTHSWGYWGPAFEESWSSTLAPALGVR